MTVWWWIAGAILLAVLIGACLTRRPLRSLAGGAFQGLCALAAVNVASVWSGVTLGLTWFSAAVCGVLGMPGTVMLLVLQVLLGI